MASQSNILKKVKIRETTAQQQKKEKKSDQRIVYLSWKTEKEKIRKVAFVSSVLTLKGKTFINS